jgi:putative transposase
MPEPLFRNRHYNTPGHAHELTFSCNQRKPYFSDPSASRIILGEIENARQVFNFDVWAYVVMPNHAHLLFWPKNHEYDIAEIQKSIKGRMSRTYSEFLLKSHPELHESFLVKDRGKMQYRFWQRGGGFDRNLWNNQPIYGSIMYIENNPVRKGLVDSRYDWEWSSAFTGKRGNYRFPVVNRSSVPVMIK